MTLLMSLRVNMLTHGLRIDILDDEFWYVWDQLVAMEKGWA